MCNMLRVVHYINESMILRGTLRKQTAMLNKSTLLIRTLDARLLVVLVHCVIADTAS
jgi:hypothetical protein